MNLHNTYTREYIYLIEKATTSYLKKAIYSVLCEAYLLQEMTTVLDTQTHHKSQQWLSVLLSLSLSAWLSCQRKQSPLQL